MTPFWEPLGFHQYLLFVNCVTSISEKKSPVASVYWILSLVSLRAGVLKL